MVQLDFKELLRVFDFVKNETSGDNIYIEAKQASIILKGIDKKGKEIEVTLYDVDYHYKPTIKQITPL